MSDDHIALDVGDPNEPVWKESNTLEHALVEMLHSVSNMTSKKGLSTIYRVSHLMAEPELYRPRIISIGPFNRDRMGYDAMEEYKLLFFRDFLDRSPNTSLKSYASIMEDVGEKAWNCYYFDSEIHSTDFLQMLLIDGCFILEIILKWYHGDFLSLANVSARISHIRSDLLLLENQLPFCVIEMLFDLFQKDDSRLDYKSSGNPLHNIIYGFFMEIPGAVSPRASGVEIHHLLHLVYQWSVPDLPQEKLGHNWRFLRSFPWFSRSRVKERRPTIPNATWLVMAGVKFKNTRPSGRFVDVVFEKGVLTAPTFRIDSAQMSRLANFMLFEQTKELKDRKVSSYVFLMDSLIDTADDVELLKGCGLIQNTLESNYDAAAFFNKLGEHCKVDHDNHYYAPLFEQVWRFYESSWNRNKTSLRLKYFSSPWAGISVVAATALMVLTGLQTYYTIAGYYPH